MSTSPITMKIVIFKEQQTGRWLVCGLDRGICASGDSMDQAMVHFDYLITAHIALAIEFKTEIFHGIKPASQQDLWDRFANAQRNGAVTHIRRRLGKISDVEAEREVDLESSFDQQPQLQTA